jgi:hypothetical protein
VCMQLDLFLAVDYFSHHRLGWIISCNDLTDFGAASSVCFVWTDICMEVRITPPHASKPSLLTMINHVDPFGADLL